MSKFEQVILETQDFDLFRSWLKLNETKLSWEGQNTESFESFWNTVFINGLSVQQVLERFGYLKKMTKVGPLNSWFKWLAERFICFVYIKKNPSLNKLSSISGKNLTELTVILKVFFESTYPEKKKEISNFFQVSFSTDKAAEFGYNKLASLLNLDQELTKNNNLNEVMKDMEVTVFPLWNKTLESIEKDFFHPAFDFSTLDGGLALQKGLRFFRDVCLIAFLGVVIILIIREGNLLYTKYLNKKVSIYEPQFNWLDRSLIFKSGANTNVVPGEKKIELVKNLEKIDFPEFEENEIRFETESEVSLTSWDVLPKNFGTVFSERSGYEEKDRQGYRDSRYGWTKVYRLLVNSQDVSSLKDKLSDIIKRYDVSQVDNVKPGQPIPGGVYYNLYVPGEHLKNFVTSVMDFGEAVLYESRTKTDKNPVGKNKVFVFVKHI